MDECINLDLLHSQIIKRPIKLDYEQSINAVVFKFIHKKCNIVVKILPIWQKNWKENKELLHQYKISNAHIKYGITAAQNEWDINKEISQLVENNHSFCFAKTIAAYKTSKLPASDLKLDKIPKQKYYILVQPMYSFDKLIPKNDLIVFQLQWALYISYKLLKFVHGDIYDSANNNVFFQNYYLPGKKYVVFKDKDIWLFQINEVLPSIVLFDFEFSDIKNIHTKIPFRTVEEYPIGAKETVEKKRELDIAGLNIVLRKIGIKKIIPQVSLKNNQDLLLGFDKYKISKIEFKKLDKNQCFIFK